MEPSVGDFVSRSRCSYQNYYYESTMSLSWKTKIRETKRYIKKNKKLTRRRKNIWEDGNLGDERREPQRGNAFSPVRVCLFVSAGPEIYIYQRYHSERV